LEFKVTMTDASGAAAAKDADTTSENNFEPVVKNGWLGSSKIERESRSQETSTEGEPTVCLKTVAR
jgi:hypothetical protein